jgi:preprotein translocase subunit SecA
MAVEAFDETREQLEVAAAASLESFAVDQNGTDLDHDDLRGPGSTWTYIVNDTPFEGTIIRLDRLLLSRRGR